MADTLTPGQTLSPDQKLESNNGRARLVMQSDGNLVLYDNYSERDLWASGTDGTNGAIATMQNDGNLVVYAPDGQSIWASNTSGNPEASLVMQDNGNAVIYALNKLELWASNTNVGAIVASAEWKHNGFHMAGDGYLTAQGQLRVDVTTWSTSWGLGFTGGCIVAVIDSGENVIHQMLIWPLGVDAKGVFWNRSRRTDHPYQELDPALAAQARRIELWFSHMPKDRWNDIMDEVNKKIEDLKKLYEKLAGDAANS